MASSLRWPRDPRHLSDIEDHLHFLAMHDWDPELQAMARQALKEMKDPAGSPEVLWMLHDALLDAGYPEDDPHVKRIVAVAGNSVAQAAQGAGKDRDLYQHTTYTPEVHEGGAYEPYGPVHARARRNMDFATMGNLNEPKESLRGSPPPAPSPPRQDQPPGAILSRKGCPVRLSSRYPWPKIPQSPLFPKYTHETQEAYQQRLDGLVNGVRRLFKNVPEPYREQALQHVGGFVQGDPMALYAVLDILEEAGLPATSRERAATMGSLTSRLKELVRSQPQAYSGFRRARSARSQEDPIEAHDRAIGKLNDISTDLDDPARIAAQMEAGYALLADYNLSNIPTPKRPRSPRKMSGVNSPAGGVLVRGIHYPGGQFIPSAEVEKAHYDVWRKVHEARAKKYSRSDGSLDTERMLAGESGPARPKGAPKARVKKSRLDIPRSDRPPPPPSAADQQSLSFDFRQAAKAPTRPKATPRQDRFRRLIEDTRQAGGRTAAQRQEYPEWAGNLASVGHPQGPFPNAPPEIIMAAQAAQEGDHTAALQVLDWIEENHGGNAYVDQELADMRKDLRYYDDWLRGEGPDELPAFDIRPPRRGGGYIG